MCLALAKSFSQNTLLASHNFIIKHLLTLGHVISGPWVFWLSDNMHNWVVYGTVWKSYASSLILIQM